MRRSMQRCNWHRPFSANGTRATCINSKATRSELVAVPLFFSLAFGCLDANLFVVLLQSSKILTGFRELPLFHTFTNVPMHEGSLAVHQIKLMIDAREHLGDCCRVADHAYGPHNFCEIATWHHSWRLIVDATFEACG